MDDLHSGRSSQGGSTITQQYVKNAFTNGERTIGRKVREAILAGQLDRQLDKDTILYRYLSTIYFGERLVRRRRRRADLLPLAGEPTRRCPRRRCSRV